MLLMRLLRALFPATERSAEKVRTEPQPDPAVVARIRAYTALSMVERYGEHGPP